MENFNYYFGNRNETFAIAEYNGLNELYSRLINVSIGNHSDTRVVKYHFENSTKMKELNQQNSRLSFEDILRPSTEDLMNNSSAKTKKDYQLQKVAFPTSEGLVFYKASEIIRCEADSNYTHICFTDGTKLLVSKTLKEVENRIPHGQFIRVHGSHYINIQFVKKYLNGRGGQVIMDDSSVIPVSRSKKSSFIDRFKAN